MNVNAKDLLPTTYHHATTKHSDEKKYDDTNDSRLSIQVAAPPFPDKPRNKASRMSALTLNKT